MYTTRAREIFFRHHKYGWVLTVVALILVSGVYFRQQFSDAAAFSFTQSNWSSGVVVGTASHSTNQAGWAYYDSSSSVVASSTVMLEPSSLTFTDDTATSSTSLLAVAGGGFGNGVNSNTSTSTPGSVRLAVLSDPEPMVAGSGNGGYTLKDDGTVWAWGQNDQNQLGDGTTTASKVPVQVHGVGDIGFLSDIVLVDGGYASGYALKSDGTLWSWGYNAYGQLGDGTTTTRSTPVQVVGVGGVGFLENVIDITASNNAAFALKSDGTVYSWGYGGYGILGDNLVSEIDGSPTPVQVHGVGGAGYLGGIVSIESNNGGNSVYALKSDGTVYAWGYGTDGNLGDGNVSHSTTPVRVEAYSGGYLSDIASIGASGGSGYAVKTNGTVWSWGAGAALGTGSFSDASRAVQVLGEGGSGYLSGIVSVGGASATGYAVDSDGAVYAWGYGGQGQIGTGSFGVNLPHPVKVHGVGGSGYLSGINSLSGGWHSIFALDSNGNVLSWGKNDLGQLGDNSTNNRNLPVYVRFNPSGSFTFSQIGAVGNTTMYATRISEGGKLYAWGNNTNGQLGDGTGTNSSYPVAVGSLSNITSVSAGTSFALAVNSSGDVYALGANVYGQLGDGTTTSSDTPVQVSGISGVSQVAASGYASHALKSDGTVYGWGYNGTGQLGDGTTNNSSTPVQVVGPGGVGYLTDITQISATPTGETVLALKSDGTVWMWGWNNAGQAGDGTSLNYKSSPVQVHGPGDVGFLTDITSVAAGGYGAMALKNDGTVWMWGSNFYGQLGDGTTTDRSFPTQVVDPSDGSGYLTNVASIAHNNYSSGVVKNDHTVWTWGRNDYGQLGDGTTTDTTTPIQVHGVGGVGFLTDVSGLRTDGISMQTRSYLADNTVYTWGHGLSGQLGNNAYLSSSYPVTVSLYTSNDNIDLGTVGYASSGTFTSAVIDLAEAVPTNTFSWNATLNAQTLTMDVRAGNTSSPDGTWTSWEVGVSNGGSIETLSGNRYFQYRANLSTSNALKTPVLNSVTFDYKTTYPTSGSLTGNAYNTEDQTNHISSLSWTETGTTTTETISFQIRTSSDGMTWSDWCGYADTGSTCAGTNYFTHAHNGATLPVDHPVRSGGDDQYLQYKVFFTGSGTATPVLSTVAVNYFFNEAPDFEMVDPHSNGIIASQASSGEVNIEYYVRDTDTLSGVANPGLITPTFEYTTDGSTWAAIPSGDMTTSSTANKAVGETAYTTHTATWFATSTVGSVDTANTQIRLTLNDNEAAHNTAQVTTAPFNLDTTAPVVSDLSAPIGGRTTTAAQITFTTDEAAVGYVEYSTQVEDDYHNISSPTALGTSHDLTLSGLPTDEVYVYRAYAVDAHGNIGSPTLGGTFTLGTPSLLSFTDDGATSTTSTLAVTGGDFDLGTQSNTTVLGSGTGASITLAGTSGPYTPMIATAVIGNSTYILKDDGTVWAWGGNDDGQLGDGTTTESGTPVQVTGLTDVIQIAASMRTAYALKGDGTVWAWGDNGSGNLGNGNAPTDSSVPIQITALSGITQIAAGGFTAYALKSDGTVYSWGTGTYGGIGDGETTQRDTPVQVPGLSGVASITAGAYNGYALMGDGTGYAWGFNVYGMVGDGTTSPRLSPTAISLTGMTSLKAGGAHAMALKADGTVYTWGYNVAGALGDGSTTNNPTPTQVGGLSGVASIHPGGIHSMVVKTNGEIWGWGDNMNGDLGNGSTTPLLAPTYLSALTNVAELAPGYLYTVIRKSDSTIYAFGLNDHNQLGDGTTTDSTIPVRSGAPSFTSGSSTYAASGTFTSAVINLAQEAAFTVLTYSKTANGQTLTVDARAGGTGTPDGSWTAWQTDISSGGDISGLAGNQYFQYRVHMSTSNSAVTPLLNSLTVFYTQYTTDTPAPTPDTTPAPATGNNAGTVTPEGSLRNPSPAPEVPTTPSVPTTPAPTTPTATPEVPTEAPIFSTPENPPSETGELIVVPEPAPTEESGNFFTNLFGGENTNESRPGEGVSTTPTFTTFLTDPLVKGIEKVTSLPPVQKTAEVTRAVITDPVGAVVTKVAATAGVAAGTALAVTSVFLNPLSLMELLLIPARIMGAVLSGLGIRRRSRRWGTVYDSVTKQPLDPAYVMLLDSSGKEVGTSITDLDGRYGFLIGPGTYTIVANKTNYTFPSKRLAGKTRDVLYDDLYFGEPLTLGAEGAVIRKNIPLDPETFDWNEFTKKEQGLMKFHGKRETLFQTIATWALWIGLPVAIAGYLVTPAPYNTIIAALYGILFVLRMVGLKPKAHGTITDQDGNPLSYAIVRVRDVNQNNKEIFHRVADQYGKYFCLVQKGQYTITVEKKNADESYTLVYTSPIIHAEKGIIRENVRVGS